MSIRNALGWTAGAQVILFILQFGLQVFISRTLTIYEVGVYAIATSMVGFLASLQSFGLSSLIIREIELSKELIRTTFTLNILFSIGLSFIIFASSFFAGKLYSEQGVTRLLWVIGLIPLITAFEFMPSALSQRNMQFSRIATISVIKVIVIVVLTVTGINIHLGYMSMAVGAISGAFVSAVLFNIIGQRYANFSMGLQSWRYVLKFGSQIFAINGISSLCLRGGDLIIGRLLGLSTLGLFSRASSLNNVLWDNIHTVFTKVVFASFAEERRVSGTIRESYIKTVDMVTVLLWPAFAGLAVLSAPVIHIIYGSKWAAAAPILQLFAGGAIILTSLTMTWEVFVVNERTGQQARFEFVRAGCMLAFTAVGCLFGVRGAASAKIWDGIVATALYRRPLSEMTGTTGKDIYPLYVRSAAVTVATIFPSLLLMILFKGSATTPLTYVSGAIIMGVMLWVITVCALRHPIFLELAQVVPMLGRLVRV